MSHILKGQRLGNLISDAIDEMTTEDMGRGDVIERVARGGGISGSTLNQIIAGEIDCPPMTRLRGFASELRGVTMSQLEAAGIADGCPYGDEDKTYTAVEFPGTTFATKCELFKSLKVNKGNLISIKKAAIKNSDGCRQPLSSKDGFAIKGINGLEEGFVYPIINTTNYIDSHNDVHLPKIWNKSLNDQSGKVFYVTDHDLKVDSVIAFPKDVQISVNKLEWSALGKASSGSTEALTFKVPLSKIRHTGASKIIQEKIDIEHSVRMQYVKMFLAVNSEDSEFSEEKELFDKHITSISNKEIAHEVGYFWGIEEAKIVQEGSMVLFGSNDATPMMFPHNEEPHKSTLNNGPSKNTHDKAEKLKLMRNFAR